MTYSTSAELIQDGAAQEREFIISAVRCARIRAQLLQNEMDEVGVALKHNLISSETAIICLRQMGAARFLTPGVSEAFQ